MGGKALPVLNFAPFRKYPAKLDQQEYADERAVCGNCLSGACCTTEDPIYLTSFDVFRLAAFFDISPAEFLLTFTQDSFDGEDSDLARRPWIDDPDSSKVTYLRRRGSIPTSPCIFLKYVNEPDGTPRRICSVHDARPLSCREFYFQHCKARITGEVASLLAEGFEKVRDREITEEMVDERLARFDTHDFSNAGVSESMEFTFWMEMKRALNVEQSNTEGARSYRMADYQDPINEKLNRVLSARYLRFEESYGPEPNGEQLMPYTTGLGFVGSPERKRIMKLVRERPSSALYAGGVYPYRVGLRTMVEGLQHAELFATISVDEAELLLRNVPSQQLFPHHPLPGARSITRRDVAAAVLNGYNHLIRFSSYLAVMGNVMEVEPPGLLEMNMLERLASYETSLHSDSAHDSHFQPVKQYLAGACVPLLEEFLASAVKPAADFEIQRLLFKLSPALPALSPELRARFAAIAATISERLQRDSLELYVRPDNLVAARLAQGRRLNSRRAWAEWERQLNDMRFAEMLGFERVNLPEFYVQSVADLEKIPFRQSYASELYRVTLSLARCMSLDNRIAADVMPYQQSARRLAAYGTRLFEWMNKVWGYEHLEVEILAGFNASIFNGLIRVEGLEQSSGFIVQKLLDSQMPDGSWSTNPLPGDAVNETQDDYLRQMYETTCACLEGLRATLDDTLDAGKDDPESDVARMKSAGRKA